MIFYLFAIIVLAVNARNTKREYTHALVRSDKSSTLIGKSLSQKEYNQRKQKHTDDLRQEYISWSVFLGLTVALFICSIFSAMIHQLAPVTAILTVAIALIAIRHIYSYTHNEPELFAFRLWRKIYNSKEEFVKNTEDGSVTTAVRSRFNEARAKYGENLLKGRSEDSVGEEATITEAQAKNEFAELHKRWFDRYTDQSSNFNNASDKVFGNVLEAMSNAQVKISRDPEGAYKELFVFRAALDKAEFYDDALRSNDEDKESHPGVKLPDCE